MTAPIVVDAGPLVAFLVARDAHHQWARGQFARLSDPLLTCEAVVAEVAYLIGGDPSGPLKLVEMIRRKTLLLPFRLQDEVSAVNALMTRYADVPISLADACLVRMAELYAESHVMTLDSDFSVYRKNGRQVIPLLAPKK